MYLFYICNLKKIYCCRTPSGDDESSNMEVFDMVCENDDDDDDEVIVSSSYSPSRVGRQRQQSSCGKPGFISNSGSGIADMKLGSCVAVELHNIDGLKLARLKQNHCNRVQQLVKNDAALTQYELEGLEAAIKYLQELPANKRGVPKDISTPDRLLQDAIVSYINVARNGY